MICLKVPEVGARLAGGACAAAALESASTIATNIASLVFIAVPRSGQPDYTPLDQNPNPMCTPNPIELLPSWNRIGTTSSPNTGELPTVASTLSREGGNPPGLLVMANHLLIPAANA